MRVSFTFQQFVIEKQEENLPTLVRTLKSKIQTATKKHFLEKFATIWFFNYGKFCLFSADLFETKNHIFINCPNFYMAGFKSMVDTRVVIDFIIWTIRFDFCGVIDFVSVSNQVKCTLGVVRRRVSMQLAQFWAIRID